LKEVQSNIQANLDKQKVGKQKKDYSQNGSINSQSMALKNQQSGGSEVEIQKDKKA
jgi:hypothetical protein